MSRAKVKTEWAGLVLSEAAGEVVVSVRQGGSLRCLWFENLGAVQQAVLSRRLRIAKWAVAIPRHVCMTKSVSLPAQDVREGLQMLEYELPSLIPLDLKDIGYSCSLRQGQDATVSLIVYIVKSKALQTFLEPLMAAHIAPYCLFPEALALQTWFATNPKRTSGRTVSTFVDSRHCTVLSSVSSRLEGISDLSDSSSGSSYFIDELSAHLLDRRTELVSPEDSHCDFLLAGRQEDICRVKVRLDELLPDSEERSLECTHLVDDPSARVEPWNGVPPSGRSLSYESALAQGVFEIGSRGLHLHANLLPRTSLAARERRQSRIRAVSAVCVTVGLVFLSCCYIWVKNHRTQQTLDLMREQIAPYEQISGDVDFKKALVTAVRQQFGQRETLLGVIRELDETLPNSINVSTLVFDAKPGQASLDITGLAETAGAAWDIPQTLERARWLSGVNIEDVVDESSPSSGTSSAQYRMHCIIQEPLDR